MYEGVSVQGTLRQFLTPQEMMFPTPNWSYLRVTVPRNVHP